MKIPMVRPLAGTALQDEFDDATRTEFASAMAELRGLNASTLHVEP
jgi:hypothetical protein